MLKKLLAVFPVFILFAFSGLFVFASPSSPVVFEVQPQPLSNEQKQDCTWKWIKSELRNRYTYLDFPSDWKPLLDAAHSDDYNEKGSELEQKVKDRLLAIFNWARRKDKTGVLAFLLENQLDFLWEQKSKWNSLVDASIGENQDALLNPKYAYLAKTPISIKKEVYESLEPLFIAAKRFGVLETWEEFAEIKIPGFKKMIRDFYFFPIEESDINAAFAAADAKNKPKLNNLWSGIKDEFKKPEHVYLVKTPILINDENYDLELLFEVAQSSFTGNGYALPLAAKIKLQDLVNANIDGENFKDALTANNQKLDHLWTQLKKVFNQPEFSKWKNTSIKIKNKNYDLSLLFAAKEKADVKGSVLPLDTKLQLQELLNDQVTSKMVENQLLALNQAEKEKENLVIGLATGGGVLVAAGLGGFLYWFFRIRK